MLVEPGVSTIQGWKERGGLKNIFETLRKIILQEKDLRFNLLFSSIIGAATLQMAWFAQPLFEKMLLPLALFGTVWTVLNLITGGSSILAHRIERSLGERMTLMIIAIFIPLMMIISGIIPDYAIIPLLVLFYFMRGVASPVLKDYINRHTHSRVRATVMSLRDLTIRVFFALFAPLAGYFSDHYSLGTGLAFSGGLIFLLSVITLALFLRNARDTGNP